MAVLRLIEKGLASREPMQKIVKPEIGHLGCLQDCFPLNSHILWWINRVHQGMHSLPDMIRSSLLTLGESTGLPQFPWLFFSY